MTDIDIRTRLHQSLARPQCTKDDGICHFIGVEGADSHSA